MEIAHITKPHPETGLVNSKLGVWLFLASEVMLFGALFSSYIIMRIGSTSWPHGYSILSVPLATVNTFALISSCYDVSNLGGVDVQNTPVQLSAMVYLIKFPGFGLHVLARGTYNALKLEGTGNVQGSVNESKWAAHAGAGVDLRLSNSFYLNADGRYVFLNVDPGNLPPPTSGAYQGDYWTATAGILWKIF